MDDDFYSAASDQKRQQALREQLLDMQQNWGMLDDQHVAPPTDSPRHFWQWVANSEQKRAENSAGSSGFSNGGSGGSGGGEFLLGLFLLPLLTIAILPAALIWHYRKKNWFYLVLTALLFAASAWYFLTKTHGAMLDTVLGVQVVFAVVYLPFAITGWICRRLNDRIAKGAPSKFGAWSWIVLISLAISFETLFFLWIEGLHWGADLVRFVGNSIVIFGGSTYISLSDYKDSATMLLAAFPNAVTLSVLQAWFRKRQALGKRAIPWLLYLPVVWVVGLALFLGFVITINHLERNPHVSATVSENQLAQAGAQPTSPSHAQCAQHHKHCKSTR
ncbi:membrane protein [Burkholderia pseudomallei]|uniref:membrane protein n=1 Tax=Burkholderia pseudomallei TaxID=28450 RepID=UPI00050FEE5A|nr:membrane protein [Burkholderia pseudomallei]KGC37032.1 putative membrane protein [Burkholderia pseudomallei]KGS57471.1 putative membrane protein [Burkholderia pseudomallei MSHR5609]